MESIQRLNKQNPKTKTCLEPFSLIKSLPRTVTVQKNTGSKTITKPKNLDAQAILISFMRDISSSTRICSTQLRGFVLFLVLC